MSETTTDSSGDRPIRVIVSAEVGAYINAIARVQDATMRAEGIEDRMVADVVERGVIWCPGCDGVLRWTQEQQGKELDEDAVVHLRTQHAFIGSTTLREPSRGDEAGR